MSKTILLKLKKAGNRLHSFSVMDDKGNVLSPLLTKEQLIQGVPFVIDDTVSVIVLSALDKSCCGKTWDIPVSSLSLDQIAAIKFEALNTASLWKHLTDTTVYNNFYGCIHPYIIEYPFAYQYQDEIVQNVKDYTKVFKYFNSNIGNFNYNQKIETNDDYFTQSIIYNDQQSSGILNLINKPKNNLQAYLKYPILNSDSKDILFAKKDNFYQYNTFWDLTKDFTKPLFLTSCDSLSLDKIPNQSNLDYGTRSFQKFKIRGKDLKIRHSLIDRSDINLVSQFTVSPSEISYN